MVEECISGISIKGWGSPVVLPYVGNTEHALHVCIHLRQIYTYLHVHVPLKIQFMPAIIIINYYCTQERP